MFKKTRFIFAVNKSLAEMGIAPAMFNAQYRQGLMEAGFKDGCSPQEVATFAALQLSIGMQPLGMEAVISGWIRDGKVRSDIIDQARRSKLGL